MTDNKRPWALDDLGQGRLEPYDSFRSECEYFQVQLKENLGQIKDHAKTLKKLSGGTLCQKTRTETR